MNKDAEDELDGQGHWTNAEMKKVSRSVNHFKVQM